MEFFKILIDGLLYSVIKNFLLPIVIKEPLFWIILIGFVVLGIIGYVLEKRAKKE